MTNSTACVLCGNPTVTEVRVSLARWRDPRPGEAMYAAIPRCVNRVACRSRCESSGEEYDVIDPGEYAELPRGVA